MNKIPHDFDRLSALADGALHGEEFGQTVDWLTRDTEALTQWHAYHVIGDVLRSSDLARGAADMDFVARLQTRLASEPLPHLVEVPESAVVRTQPAAEISRVTPIRAAVAQQAANADVFRWKAVAGFASLAAVAAIGWSSFAGFGGASSDAVLAAAPAAASANGAGAVQLVSATTVPAAGASAARAAPFAATVPVLLVGNDTPQVMLRNPRLDELLAAHGQATAGSVLQSPPGFVRNASFEGADR